MIHFRVAGKDGLAETRCGLTRWPTVDVAIDQGSLQDIVARRGAKEAICKKCLYGPLKAGHNPENGKPQIVDEFGRILVEGPDYKGFAQLFSNPDGTLFPDNQLGERNPIHFLPMYVVAGDYWLGAFPTNVVLKVEEV